MNPLKGFREDLVDRIGRLREQVYPDLNNTEVAVLLRQIAQSFHQTDSQAKARARDEAIREAAARGLAVPGREEGIRDWGLEGDAPLTHEDVAAIKRGLGEQRSATSAKAMAAEREFYRAVWSERDVETQFAADRCAGESLPVGRNL
jgi:hypothetical protein